MYSFAEQYFFLPLFTLLLALAILTLVFPEKALSFKKSKPIPYVFILFLSGLIQFFLLNRGFLEMGIAYGKIHQSQLFDYSLIFLPFIYFFLFALSVSTQKNILEQMEKTSLTLAVYASFIIGPFTYLLLMGVLYYFLRP